MTERESLRANIIDEMRRLDDPVAIRNSLTIAQDYISRGYDMPVRSVQLIVLEVARKLGFMGVY